MNIFLWLLSAIITVYILMIYIAWFIGHPTPLRWYRPDMLDDPIKLIDGYAYESVYVDSMKKYYVVIPELKIYTYQDTEQQAIDILREHICVYCTFNA